MAIVMDIAIITKASTLTATALVVKSLPQWR
jgi:hypothetical protein